MWQRACCTFVYVACDVASDDVENAEQLQHVLHAAGTLRGAGLGLRELPLPCRGQDLAALKCSQSRLPARKTAAALTKVLYMHHNAPRHMQIQHTQHRRREEKEQERRGNVFREQDAPQNSLPINSFPLFNIKTPLS